MEIINSFFTNIKDKLTNPFFGTLILVLIIHHWELWFSIFNFDNDCTLDDKVIFIKTYIENNLTLLLFTWNIVLAIIFMFIGYLVIVGTRSLVMWVEFWLMPIITGKIVNKNVVRKSEFDEVVKEREEYFDQYEEQRKNVRYFSKTIDEQTEQIKLKDLNFLEQTNTINKTQHELESKKRELNILNSENQTNIQKINEINILLEALKIENETKIKQVKKYRNLFLSSESEIFYNTVDKFPPEILDKVKELKNKDKWGTFKYIGDYFTNGGTMGSETLTEMVELGISFDRDSRQDFTPLGEIIWNYRKLFEEYNYDIY
jgi:hypothetical protein